MLRRAFRAGRKQRESDAAKSVSLQEKMSFGYDLLPGTEDDAARAGDIDFGSRALLDTNSALSKPLFSTQKIHKFSNSSGSKLGRRSKPERLAEKRADLAAEIRHNTRTKLDPFLAVEGTSKDSIKSALGIKRKRAHATKEQETGVSDRNLVDYDSD